MALSMLPRPMRVILAVVGLIVMVSGMLTRTLEPRGEQVGDLPVAPGGTTELHGIFDAAGYDIVVIDSETTLVFAIPSDGGTPIEVYRGDRAGARAWVEQHGTDPEPLRHP